MVPEENNKIERFIWGLPDNIQGVLSKRESSTTTYGATVCSSHLSRGRTWLKLSRWATMRREEPPVASQRVVTCFGCGGQGHYKSDCPKLKNQNRGNMSANNDARGRAYALGGGDGNPDSNVVTGTFLLNNRYAYILFDSGADRSFVSTTFSALIDITPTALDVSYTVELADGRSTASDTIIRGMEGNGKGKGRDEMWNKVLILIRVLKYMFLNGKERKMMLKTLPICPQNYT
ncbi:putative reverse transcriptase domain-containing protein [Tanacetum coccineum]